MTFHLHDTNPVSMSEGGEEPVDGTYAVLVVSSRDLLKRWQCFFSIAGSFKFMEASTTSAHPHFLNRSLKMTLSRFLNVFGVMLKSKPSTPAHVFSTRCLMMSCGSRVAQVPFDSLKVNETSFSTSMLTNILFFSARAVASRAGLACNTAAVPKGTLSSGNCVGASDSESIKARISLSLSLWFHCSGWWLTGVIHVCRAETPELVQNVLSAASTLLRIVYVYPLKILHHG